MSLVWYAAYGSNIDLDRFIKYFNGEDFEVNGQIKRYTACSDQSNPIQEEPYVIPNRRFFFAKESGTWKVINANGSETKYGVGFISNKINSRSFTYAKLYLISRVQFQHLFEQKNSRKTPRTIDYQLLQNEKKQDFNYKKLLEKIKNGFTGESFNWKIIVMGIRF